METQMRTTKSLAIQAMRRCDLALKKFTIDPLGDRIFDGYTKDEDWNGWACPYFTFEQAQSIVTAYHDNGWPARNDQANDHFVFSMKHAGGQEDEIYTPIEEGGLK